jgi:hypothetical protein
MSVAAAPQVTARRRLAVEQLTVAGGQLAAGAGNLLFALVAARVLAPGAFAELAAFLALYLVIHVPAASLSAGSALQPALAAEARRRVLAIGVAAGAGLALLSAPAARELALPPALLLAAAASAPTAGLIALDRGRLYGLGRHARVVGSLLAEPLVRLGAGIALAAVVGPVGGAVGVVAAGWAALAIAHLPASPGPREAPAPRPATAVGRPAAAVLTFLLLAVVQSQDIVLANAVLPEDEAGRFAVLSTLGGAAAFATTTVPLVLLTHSRGGRGGALRVAVAVAGALGLAVAAVVAISPAALVGAVFGARYEDVGALAVPYVLAMGLLGVARVLTAHACATGRAGFAVGLVGAVGAGQAALVVALGDDAAGVATATLVATAALTLGAGAIAVLDPPPLRVAAAGAIRALARPEALAITAVTLLGLGLRLAASRGVWLDEATSMHQVSLPFADMLRELRGTDVHPPLHHVVLWGTVRLLGNGELAVRLPSLFAATALIPALYLAGRDIYDRRAGRVAAGLGAVAPFAVWYAQEARMYALFMLFALLAVWMQVRILRDGRIRDWLGFVAAAAALAYTQYFALLLVAVQQLGFIVALVARRPDLRALAPRWLGFSLLLALALLPLLSFAHDQYAANEAAGKGFQSVPSQTGGELGESGEPPGAYAAITNALWAVYGYHSDATMTALTALWPLLMLLALSLLGRGHRGPTLLISACAVLPALALFALGQVKPFVFEARYFVGAVPLALLLVARMATSWPARPAARVAACAVAVAGVAGGLADQQLNGSNPRVYDFRGAIDLVERRARAGDVLVYSPQYLRHMVAYYGDGLDARPVGRALPEPGRGRRVFLLASFLDKPGDRRAATEALRRLDREHRLVRTDTRPQIRIWEFR